MVGIATAGAFGASDATARLVGVGRTIVGADGFAGGFVGAGFAAATFVRLNATRGAGFVTAWKMALDTTFGVETLFVGGTVFGINPS